LKKSLVIAALILLSISTGAKAWGPATHTWVTNELLDNPQGNQILTLCATDKEHRDAFLAGSMIPDVTVVYYFESGGQMYRATHNWNFQQSVFSQAQNTREQAFAYGIAQHLISDSVSHQFVIPKAIEDHRIPNWLIHPLLEQKYDSYLKIKYPEIDSQSKDMLHAVIHGPYADRYVQMVQNALPPDFDAQSHINKLAAALDTFYDPEGGGKNPGNTGIFGLYPMISSFADWIAHFTQISNVEHIDIALSRTLSENRNIFNNWPARYALTPHGFDDIAASDESANLFDAMFMLYILLIFIIPVAAYIYFKKIIVIPITLSSLIVGLIGWMFWVYLTI
jgi:hypothetical protein